MVDWRKLHEHTEKRFALKDVEYLERDEGTIGFAPQDEIGLRHELIVPADPSQLISKNLRVGNLSKLDHHKLTQALLFTTYMEGEHNLDNDEDWGDLKLEIKKDLHGIGALSQSVKGVLVQSILNPMRRSVHMFGDRGQQQGHFWNKKNKEGTSYE